MTLFWSSRKQVAGRKLTAHLASLQEAFHVLSVTKPHRRAFADKALGLIVECASVKTGAWLGWDAEGERWSVLATAGMEARITRALTELMEERRWELPARCMRTRRISVIEAAEKDLSVPRPLVAMHPRSLTIAALPLHDNNAPVGVLLLFTPERRAFPDNLLQVLSQTLRAGAEAIASLPASPEVAIPARAPVASTVKPAAAAPPAPGGDSGTRGARVPREPGERPVAAGQPQRIPAIPPSPPQPTDRIVALEQELAVLRKERQRWAALDDEVKTLRREAERRAGLQKQLAAAREAQRKVPALEREIEHLERQLRWSVSAASAQQAEAARASEVVASAERRVERANAKVEELRAAALDLQRRLDEALTAAADGHSAARAKEDQLLEFSQELAKVREFEQAWASSEASRADLQAERESLRQELVASKTKNAVLRQKVEEVEGTRRSVEAARRSLRSELAQVRSASANSRKECAKEARRAQEFEQAWKTIEPERLRLDAEVHRIQGQLAASQREQARTEGMLEHSTALLSRMEAEVRHLSVELAQSRAKVGRLEQAEKRVAHLEGEQQALESTRHQLQLAEAERLTLQDDLYAARVDLESQVRQGGQVREELESQVAELERTLSGLEAELREQRGREADWTSRIAELEGVRATIDTEATEQRKLYGESVARVAELESACEQLREQLHSARARADESLVRLRGELDSVRGRERDLGGRVEVLTNAEAERARLQDRCEELTAALAAADENARGLQAQLESLKERQPPAALDSAISLDPSLTEAFILEVKEYLGQVETIVAELAAGTATEAAFQRLEEIFRAVAEPAGMVGEEALVEDATRLANMFGGGSALTAESAPQAQVCLARLFARVEMGAPRLPVAPDRPQPQAYDLDIDPELLEAFAIEADEEIEACEQVLLKLEQDSDDRDLLYELFRHYHTLKGAAAAVGLTGVTAQLHHGETLLEAVGKGDFSIDGSRLVDFCLRLLDSVTALLEQARGHSVEADRIIPDVEQAINLLWSPPSTEGDNEAGRSSRSDQDTAPVAVDRREAQTTAVRVEAKHLKALMSDVDHLVSSRWGLQKEIAYLKQLAQQVGASPVSGRFAEKLDQVVERLARQGEGFEQTCTGVERQIQQLRQAPLDSIFRRLFRPVRDAARQENKLVEFEAHNGDVQVDRAILDGVYGPLLHVVRNAVAHGIEPPEVREGEGKSPTGNICITASTSDGVVVLSVQDDGAGIDFDKILAKARRLGMAEPDEVPDRQELVAFIFQPGFSTVESASDLAGRGVGMDVVAREVAALRGRVEIDSEHGQGTTVRLTLPAGSGGDA